MMKKNTTPKQAVKQPFTKNTIFQGAIAVPCFFAPTAIPYATKPPKIWPKPLNENQKPTRVPCSFLVYHWDVNRAKPGVTADSKIPKKTAAVLAFVILLSAAHNVRRNQQKLRL